MKFQFIFMKLFAGILCLALLFTSCKKDDETPPTDNRVQFNNIPITGTEEVPSNNSTATGIFNGTYNPDTKILNYSITYTGITPTAMHFHKGESGENGGVVIPIGEAPYSSPIDGATPALTEDQEADLLNGLWYVNIHSADLPGGEIRGQVVE